MFGLKQKKNVNRKVEPARNLKEKAKNRNFKPYAIATLVCVLMVSVVLVYERVSNDILFPITTVSVIGQLQHVKKNKLKSLVLNDLEQGFFDVDLNTYAQKIEAINWVAQATLRRVWPNKIEILVREHQAIAIWNKTTLISRNGVLFEVASLEQFKHLTLVTGQKMDAKELLIAYSELDHLIAAYGLHIIQLERVRSGEMNVIFNTNLHSKFALKDKETQYERFASLLKSGVMTVKNNANMMNDKALKSIDMRYSNGFSVVWMEPEAQLNKKLARDTNGKQHV